MNHLYSMFAKQVQAYCQSKTNGDASQCKKNMMMYGVVKLNDMEESHLDQMDPYQRNANNIRKFSFLSPSILVRHKHPRRPLDASKSGSNLHQLLMNRLKRGNWVDRDSWLTFCAYKESLLKVFSHHRHLQHVNRLESIAFRRSPHV